MKKPFLLITLWTHLISFIAVSNKMPRARTHFMTCLKPATCRRACICFQCCLYVIFIIRTMKFDKIQMLSRVADTTNPSCACHLFVAHINCPKKSLGVHFNSTKHLCLGTMGQKEEELGIYPFLQQNLSNSEMKEKLEQFLPFVAIWAGGNGTLQSAEKFYYSNCWFCVCGTAQTDRFRPNWRLAAQITALEIGSRHARTPFVYRFLSTTSRPKVF